MAEVRGEYPFQISYEDARLPRSLVVLRAETAEDLGRQLVEAQAALETVLGTPEGELEPVEAPNPAPAKPPAFVKPPAAKGGVSRPKCAVCGSLVFDNREKKAKGEYAPNAPDYKCGKPCDTGFWPGRYAIQNGVIRLLTKEEQEAQA